MYLSYFVMTRFFSVMKNCCLFRISGFNYGFTISIDNDFTKDDECGRSRGSKGEIDCFGLLLPVFFFHWASTLWMYKCMCKRPFCLVFKSSIRSSILLCNSISMSDSKFILYWYTILLRTPQMWVTYSIVITLSVSLSVCLSNFICALITPTVFHWELSYFVYG